MNTTIKLAVASALFAAASTASAGIMIPAGDWTLDIGGNVNAYYTNTHGSGASVAGGLGGSAPAAGQSSNTSNITTGLLPNFLTVSGKTRENDLDVAFTISIQPGAATATAGTLGSMNQRQAFLTFGDKSWGSIKLGKDLGIFASDAILSDMTLLGVGAGAASVGNTTLGRIGTGYLYADWKSQIAYSSPNWNGFSFTAGVTQAWDQLSSNNGATTPVNYSATSTGRGGSEPAFEGKASYEWAGDVAGKVWVSGITQKVQSLGITNLGTQRAEAVDIGANVNVAGFGLTGYYYDGSGVGTTLQMLNGFDTAGNKRDSNGGYVQATYTIPNVGTKLGISWGESKLDKTAQETASNLVAKNEMWTIGAYHPLTKHLNLVAEYSDVKAKAQDNTEGKAQTVSLGAILFF
ncbi:hypothetical protein GALL_154370 [mine drainage metagenome]|uniref:Porin domain-containing protein n=1 Tax=mine drainage metagenome TaxID=410659 RepID=A0A1J5SQZ1_9ZZZZ